MSRIRAGKCRPGIKALLEVANRDAQKLAASDLGFALGPRLNAAGRLDDMSVGVALLLCDNIGEARVLANELDALNQTRKEIEQGMQVEALTLCEKLERSRDATRRAGNVSPRMASGRCRYSGFAHQRAFSSSGYRLCASR